MEGQAILGLVLAAGLLMDLIAIVLLFLQGRYLGKMNEKMVADDMAIFLQGRRAEEILKEMREELKRAG
jgi:uncharacterized membrane protein